MPGPAPRRRCSRSNTSRLRNPSAVAETVLRMVVGIRRHRRLDYRMLLQLPKNDGYGPLELCIVARGHILRQFLHFDIRRNAVSLHFPVAVEAENRVAWRGHGAAVDQSGVAADADQSAPGAHADQGSEPRLAEVPGHGVAS